MKESDALINGLLSINILSPLSLEFLDPNSIDGREFVELDTKVHVCGKTIYDEATKN